MGIISACRIAILVGKHPRSGLSEANVGILSYNPENTPEKKRKLQEKKCFPPNPAPSIF